MAVPLEPNSTPRNGREPAHLRASPHKGYPQLKWQIGFSVAWRFSDENAPEHILSEFRVGAGRSYTHVGSRPRGRT